MSQMLTHLVCNSGVCKSLPGLTFIICDVLSEKFSLSVNRITKTCDPMRLCVTKQYQSTR